MRQAWVTGYVTLFILLGIIDSVVTGGNSLNDATRMSPMNILLHPSFVNQSSGVSALYSLVSNIGTYIDAFIKVIFCYYPSLFSAGLGQWIYMFVLAVAIGGIVSIVQMMRGVRSG